MSVRIRIPDLPPALTPMIQPFERTTQDSVLQPPPLIELSPFDASASPAWTDADAELSMTSTSRRSLWYRSKAFFGYASRDGEQLDRRTFVREMWFVFVATTQLVVTIVLTAFGVSNKTGNSDQNEFSACPGFGILNLVWLARTAFVGYLVLWAHQMRGRIEAHMEGRTNGSTSGRHTKDDSRLESHSAARSPWDVVSERTAVIHMRLITLGAPVVTFVCYCVTLFLWYTRLDGCREVAPHITTLTSIIATAANFGYAWWHLKNLVVSVQEYKADKRAKADAGRFR